MPLRFYCPLPTEIVGKDLIMNIALSYLPAITLALENTVFEVNKYHHCNMQHKSPCTDLMENSEAEERNVKIPPGKEGILSHSIS